MIFHSYVSLPEGNIYKCGEKKSLSPQQGLSGQAFQWLQLQQSQQHRLGEVADFPHSFHFETIIHLVRMCIAHRIHVWYILGNIIDGKCYHIYSIHGSYGVCNIYLNIIEIWTRTPGLTPWNWLSPDASLVWRELIRFSFTDHQLIPGIIPVLTPKISGIPTTCLAYARCLHQQK